jgi:ABC-2 type transport system permease protein
MRFSKAWIIASRDFKIFRRKKNILYAIILWPCIIAVLFPLVVEYSVAKGIPVATLPRLLNAFAFWLVIGAASLPTGIASYSIVGEKVEKSLEPLLATPITDGEILLGKSIAAFLPAIGAIYTGAAVFMGLIDELTFGKLGYFYFPSGGTVVLLMILVPVAAILSIELMVIASARVNDVRTASSLGGVMFMPFLGIYIACEIGLINLNTNGLLIISAILLALDVALFYVSIATFRREEILTKWK